MKKVKKVMTTMTASVVLMICSCSESNQKLGLVDTYNFSMGDAISRTAEEPKAGSFETALTAGGQEALQKGDKQETGLVETVERKIIKQGTIRFKTTDVNRTKLLIVQAVIELNGYIANDNAYHYSEQVEHKLIIRVPADKFDALLATISESVDQLESKNIDVLDVTEEYIDIEARIKTKKDLQNRYREILKQATKVEEILQIEKEMGNLQTEIESVEGQMRYLKDKISFSILNVTYYQYQAKSSAFDFSSRIVDGIKNGWEVFLWFIIGVSNIWVFILLIVATIFLLRFWRKKKKKSAIDRNNQN